MSAWKDSDSEGEQDEHKIPDTLVTKLVVAVRNEQASPELLPYPHTLLTNALRELDTLLKEAQEEEAANQVQTSVLGAAATGSLLPFQPPDITRLDLQRLQYLVSELVRTRVAKIQNFAFTIVHETAAAAAAASQSVGDPAGGGQTSALPTSGVNWDDVLSENEKLLAGRIAQITHKCILDSGLSHVPESLQHLTPNPPRAEGKEILAQPYMDKYVFVMCLEDVGRVEAIAATCMKGDVYLAMYSAFRDFLLSGKVRLL